MDIMDLRLKLNHFSDNKQIIGLFSGQSGNSGKIIPRKREQLAAI